MEDVHIETLIQAASYLHKGEKEYAKKTIQQQYPFVPIQKRKRRYSVKEMMRQFFQDGFIDRYSGTRLINPGLLRVMSVNMADVFPYHPHWKVEECHIAYWEYQPTIDHIFPVSLGGEDEPSNWATTSMAHNLAKGSFTLDQMGWSLKEKGDIQEWDGGSKLFIQLVECDPSLVSVSQIKLYYSATKEMFKEYKIYFKA